jgi:hypothetical protein
VIVSENALTESRTIRAATVERTDVLDKVKALAMLPDGVHVTTEMVASYYEVPLSTIESVVEDHREELEANGRRVMKGAELRDFAAPFGGVAKLGLHHNTRSLAVFTRKAVLNVGQLLKGSNVAQQVRTYLLEVEEAATPQQRSQAAEVAALAQLQAGVLRTLDGIVDPAWLEAKGRHVAARALGEEPELDPARRPLTVGEFLEDKGVTGEALRSLSPAFGKRLKRLYRERYGKDPGSVDRFIDGALREVAAYTEQHRPLFEQVWAEVSR